MRERKRLLLEIESIEYEVRDLEKKTDEINLEIYDYNKKVYEIDRKHEEYKAIIKDIEKELKEKIKEFEKLIAEKMENIQKEPKAKIRKLKKKLTDCIIERKNLKDKIKEIISIYVENGIPVPENEGYEISNGLLGMKRDLNLILTGHLSEEEIRQVFYLIYYTCIIWLISYLEQVQNILFGKIIFFSK
jgi:predicted PilT family ATPase